jgi:hypothetical protein
MVFKGLSENVDGHKNRYLETLDTKRYLSIYSKVLQQVNM